MVWLASAREVRCYIIERNVNHQERIEPASAKKLSFATTACWSAVQERALVNYMMDKGFVASFWENAAK